MAHQRIVRLVTGAALLTGLSFVGISSASADSMACSALAAAAQGQQGGADGYTILKARELTRKQDRPFAYIPTGVALIVRAPRHVTEADLYNALTECSKLTQDQTSPLCVKGAEFRVRVEGGNFLVEVTSKDRGVAREIQQRAKHFTR
ncbi:MAG: hypothetical protein QM778_20345 [Myxococcales bacterium]